MTASELLRQELIGGGKTPWLIALDTGVPENAIEAFLTGGEIRIDHAELIADWLGCEVVIAAR